MFGVGMVVWDGFTIYLRTERFYTMGNDTMIPWGGKGKGERGRCMVWGGERRNVEHRGAEQSSAERVCYT